VNLQVYIGYDDRQPLAFQVLAHSIWRTCSSPVSITRLDLRTLPMTRRGLTQFTYSRFLVPHLSGYEGFSIFMDSDMLCREDVTLLLTYPLAYPETPVFVSKNPRRFEWPSLMVFNTPLCRTLAPPYVDDAKTKLFDFAWAKEIGELPLEWNHLVGYDAPNPKAKAVHFTQGIPCWPETKNCEFADEWREVAKNAVSTVSFEALMGRSVHREHVMAQLAKEQANSKL
jgi:hypothetical protein